MKVIFIKMDKFIVLIIPNTIYNNQDSIKSLSTPHIIMISKVIILAMKMRDNLNKWMINLSSNQCLIQQIYQYLNFNQKNQKDSLKKRFHFSMKIKF